MAAITAYAFLGHPQPNDGGLSADYMAQLSEGSRPAWILDMAPGAVEADDLLPVVLAKPVIWIPTLEHMLEDLVLLLCIHILEGAEADAVRACAERHGLDLKKERVECYSIPEPVRNELYRLTRELDGGWKLGLTLFDGSHLNGRLDALAEYQFQAEVCLSTFHRYRNRWAENRLVTNGNLRPIKETR